MRHRRFFVGMAILLVLVFILTTFDREHAVGVEKGYAKIGMDSGWSRVIADCINKAADTVVAVDGNPVKTSYEDSLYLNGEGGQVDWMVATDKIGDILTCFVGKYSEGNILLQRQNQEIVVDTEDGSILVNGDLTEEKAKLRNGKWYVPLNLVDTVFGYHSDWNAEDKYIALNRDETTEQRVYPAMYDYRLTGRMPDVRDQGSDGDCWAYAAVEAIESSLRPENKVTISVDHLVANNGYRTNSESGGKKSMALAYVLAWNGPVSEESYENDDPGVLYHVQEARMISSKNLSAIKENVFLYGGVQTSIYMGTDYLDYYNEEESAYCYIGTEKINHDVVIVGWDDNFPKESFPVEPEADGAFICLNSWGKKFGEDGCFYVSYFDTNIAIYNLAYTKMEQVDNYDHIHQTDLCGYTAQMGYEDESAYFANVFTAEGEEEVEAVGFYALGEGTGYEIYLEKNPENLNNLKPEHRVAEGSFNDPGFYTVSLREAEELKKGDRYAVIIHITTPGVKHPIAVEVMTAESQMMDKVELGDGCGYISHQGKFWSSSEGVKNANVCMKVYTNDRKGIE